MALRYSILTNIKSLEDYFQVGSASIVKREYDGNSNVSAGDYVPVITNRSPKEIELFQFGFTPYWAREEMQILNARSEGDHNKENDVAYTGAKGIIRKPMFRKAIRSQRCLVLANGFIEGPPGQRLHRPYLFYAPKVKRPFAMAGIWDEWEDTVNGMTVCSFAIITTTANALLQRIGQQRSPVILPVEDEKRWLRNDLSLSDITSMLRPFDPTDYNAYPISPAMRNTSNKKTELLKPIGEHIRPTTSYRFHQTLELFGMGETRARRRK